MISELILPIVQDDWVDFKVHKVANSRLMWFNPDEVWKENKKLSLDTLDKAKNQFLQDNAYAIANNKSYEGVAFDMSDAQILIAERYGGTGIGMNGGGARCGNTDKFQLKGIGANCFVGDISDRLHSYGGLDAPAAILETINSYVFGKILPLGTVKIHGLIWLGEKAGFDVTKNVDCWGVIMVRDKSLRPAHLMRVIDFVPKPEHKVVDINDIARVRRINKKLSSSLNKNHNKFIVQLGSFLQNQANQFGFARAARIMNGVVSPSNCTLDGRWIDLNSCSFVSAGKNYSIRSQFYTEHQAPLGYALELLHAYSKYNNIRLTANPLIDYHQEQFYAYFQHHIGFVLGLPPDLLPDTSDDWKIVAASFYRIIHSAREIEIGRAEFSSDDPVFNLLKFLYMSLVSGALPFKKDINGIDNPDKLLISFKNLMRQAYTHYFKNNSYTPLYQFILESFLSSMKRSYYSAIYYLPLLEKEVRVFCDQAMPDQMDGFINNYCDIANWVFDRQTDNIVLFKVPNLIISFNVKTKIYLVKDNCGQQCFPGFDQAFDYLQNHFKDTLYIRGFNGMSFFEALLIPLQAIENNKEVLEI